MAVLTLNLKDRPKNELREVPPYGMFYNGHRFTVHALKDDLVVGEELTTKPHDQDLRERNLAKLLSQQEVQQEDDPPVKDDPQTGDDAGTDTSKKET